MTSGNDLLLYLIYTLQCFIVHLKYLILFDGPLPISQVASLDQLLPLSLSYSSG